MGSVHAYAEIYSGTPYSSGPVTYYILRFDLLTAIREGRGQITAPTKRMLQQDITEQMKKGVHVVTSTLPPRMAVEETKVFTERVDQCLEVKVKRISFDKAA